MHIVMADPSRVVLRVLSDLLRKHGYKVASFTDGRQAFDYIVADETVDVLLTSFEPRTMSGLELCWKTRMIMGSSRSIYILVMSASNEKRKLIEALDSGADDFISKPPLEEELHARLRAAERLVTMQRHLIRMATQDPLTGILNRRAFFARCEDMRASAGERPLAAVMFDIDHFKRVNDQFGHDIGDLVIKGIAEEASHTVGILGRLGGEEFALLLPGGGMREAQKTAESLRKRCAARSFDRGETKLQVTCSFGISLWEASESIDAALKRADIALYAAKSQGRNCVVTSDNLPPMTEIGSVAPLRQRRRAAPPALAS